jgi:hypothetical protein
MSATPLPEGNNAAEMIRRLRAIDAEIFGTLYANAGIIGGDVTIEGTLTGNDILSSNWDGTIPVDLSSGADGGATVGYAFDGSAGAAQLETIYARGGEIGNLDIVDTLTLSSGAIFRTAASGSRWEWNIDASGTTQLDIYSGLGTEYLPGRLYSFNSGAIAFLNLQTATLGDVTDAGYGALSMSANTDGVGQGFAEIQGFGRGTYAAVANVVAGAIGSGDASITISAVSVGGSSSIALSADAVTITQEAWTAPTLLNSWVNFGSGFQNARYRRDANGTIHIQGLVKSGSAANAIIFTLPSGYRPAGSLIFSGRSVAGSTDFRIGSDGNVLHSSGGSTTWNSITVSFQL